MSLIVIIKDDEKTNEFKYSQDEGITWNTVKFYDKKVDVHTITRLNK